MIFRERENRVPAEIIIFAHRTFKKKGEKI